MKKAIQFIVLTCLASWAVAGVGMMIVFCILLSPVMTYIVIKSKSVVPAAVFHGTMNAAAGIGILYLAGGNDLTIGRGYL